MTTVATKKAVVIGGSYVGMKAVETLATLKDVDVTLVEKNSHFQHLFAFPRISVVPGFAEKAFVPYVAPFSKPSPPSAGKGGPGGRGDDLGRSGAPSTPHLVHGIAHSLTPSSVILADGKEIPYDYLILATGTSGSSSSAYTTLGANNTGGVELLGTEKPVEVARFRDLAKEVAEAKRVAVIGGGAYGVQVALDIAEYFPNQKEVILVHSRTQLMNRFHGKLHEIAMAQCTKFGVKTVLGQRVKEIKDAGAEKVVVMMDGHEVEADCVIPCTGSKPLSSPLLSLAPAAVDPSSGFIKVKPTMQIDSADLPHVFAVGDVADTGAHKAARPAQQQVEVAVSNIRRLMTGSGEKLDTYEVPPASIHLALGLKESVKFRNPAPGQLGEPSPNIAADGDLEMGCIRIWANRAPGVQDFDA